MVSTQPYQRQSPIESQNLFRVLNRVSLRLLDASLPFRQSLLVKLGIQNCWTSMWASRACNCSLALVQAVAPVPTLRGVIEELLRSH